MKRGPPGGGSDPCDSATALQGCSSDPVFTQVRTLITGLLLCFSVLIVASANPEERFEVAQNLTTPSSEAVFTLGDAPSFS